MFTGLVTVRIEKDSNYAKYIKLIREYDNSLTVAQIKKAIDTGDVVFSFDSENNPLISDGRTNSLVFLETYFIKTLRALKKMGAKMVVTEEKYGYICEEFGSPKKKSKAKDTMTTDPAVIEEIQQRWNLPQDYLEYLRNHPKSQKIETEDEESLERLEITIYGANDLIRSQDGYSYNPVEKCDIKDWDENHIVIADAEADPFCLDISAGNSPVYFAMHGMDEWDFDVYSKTFREFLERLGLA